MHTRSPEVPPIPPLRHIPITSTMEKPSTPARPADIPAIRPSPFNQTMLPHQASGTDAFLGGWQRATQHPQPRIQKTHSTSAYEPTQADAADNSVQLSVKSSGKKKHRTFVLEATVNDVLLGRGSISNDHQGNIAFRALIRRMCKEYKTAPVRGDKMKLARKVISIIRAKKGRFLRRLDPDEASSVLHGGRRSDNNDDSSASTEVYEVIDDERALLQKTKQAFRHKVRQSSTASDERSNAVAEEPSLTTPPPTDFKHTESPVDESRDSRKDQREAGDAFAHQSANPSHGCSQLFAVAASDLGGHATVQTSVDNVARRTQGTDAPLLDFCGTHAAARREASPLSMSRTSTAHLLRRTAASTDNASLLTTMQDVQEAWARMASASRPAVGANAGQDMVGSVWSYSQPTASGNNQDILSRHLTAHASGLQNAAERSVLQNDIATNLLLATRDWDGARTLAFDRLSADYLRRYPSRRTHGILEDSDELYLNALRRAGLSSLPGMDLKRSGGSGQNILDRVVSKGQSRQQQQLWTDLANVEDLLRTYAI